MIWYTAGLPAYASGGASKQLFDDFILKGPFDKKLASILLSDLIAVVEQLTERTIEWAHLPEPI